jgi:hypothetical protein
MNPDDAHVAVLAASGVVDVVDERFDWAMQVLRADQIIRDLDRLARAWRCYVRQHPPLFAGQLDLF